MINLLLTLSFVAILSRELPWAVGAPRLLRPRNSIYGDFKPRKTPERLSKSRYEITTL